ncbi:helix-turn-helix transcriptional regulator [Rhodococcus qingshengii]|jgi:transcriptional regulator with XRE-family HTH domain|nr:transcriptional regulator [Rhodococcus sp. 008]AZI60791.1 XRE family transcriptional regulator [Rhodococcus sp. NJ-530]MBP1054112.1 helix-turn-helix transcriptional regulator [Rhodococcus qingshengii]MBQ7803441.1 helix-turn-helix transcriptional regulator [Rhodococcus sp. (in: high G+C Gram-positive bacteria)]MBQ9740611.1 helix-turn-helix transcriptional regulator [Kiritimatiellia bacterium]MBW0289949.1 XRE family transcriptional regulator [Rhodococcus sp. MH15]OFE06273.1 transcriptional r
MTAMSGFSAWVENQLELRSFGDIQEAARALKIRPSELSRWLSAKRPPTQDTMRTACQVFDAPIMEVLVAAGYLTSEEAEPGMTPPSIVATISTQSLVDELTRRGIDRQSE